MDARRAIAHIKRTGTGDLSAARAAVDIAKRFLGERGPVWWDDGASDCNRRMAVNTVYRDWYTALSGENSSQKLDEKL